METQEKIRGEPPHKEGVRDNEKHHRRTYEKTVSSYLQVLLGTELYNK